MAANFQYGQSTLRGLLRTGYVRAEVGAYAGQLQKPIFLTLSEPIDISPDPTADKESFWAYGKNAIWEVHVAPMDDQGRYPDFDQYVGSIVEISGDLFPEHTAHHFRPALISCGPNDIRIVEKFGLNSVIGSKILSHGSGVIINSDGHILTAHHVVHGQAYSVRRGLSRAEARVVAIHPEMDVAVLQTDLFKTEEVWLRGLLPPLLGEAVFACGYPLRPFLGHSMSITSGLVSSLAAARDGSVWVSAPIQKGNSGGPVFDEFGNVLALVNNRLSSTKLKRLLDKKDLSRDSQDGLQLMNFALPVFSITPFLQQHGIPYDSHPQFMSRLPDDARGLRAAELAERAQVLCVEVESWTAVTDEA